VLNNDLIGTEGSGELIGGSQREDDYDILKAAIEEEGLKGPEYQWYLDLSKVRRCAAQRIWDWT